MKTKALIKSLLLHRNLPSNIKQRCIQQNMAVVFVDIVNSSRLINTSSEPSHANLAQVTELFASFDTLIAPHGGMRIKTNGDQYIAVVKPVNKCFETYYFHDFFGSVINWLRIKLHGLSAKSNLFVSDILNTNESKNETSDLVFRTFLCCNSMLTNSTVDIKIGVSYGKVTMGGFDLKHPQIDIWGLPVLLAARLESVANKKELVVDHTFFEHLYEHQNEFKQSDIYLKGIGKTSVYSKTFHNNLCR